MSLSSKAQSTDGYHPFLKEGKVWNCCIHEVYTEHEDQEIVSSGWQTVYYSLTLSGDSVVNGTTYHKMHGKPLSIVRKDGEGKIFSIPATDMVALWPKLWREEGKKVYGYIWNKEQLYYDFSVELGSVIVIDDATTTVTSVDTVTANGQQFRRLEVERFGGYEPIWVEGVGHIGGPFMSTMYMVNDGRSYELLSCYEDGKCIFTQKDFRSEPGVDRIEDLSPALSKGEGAVFDLQGRRLNAVPAKGLYIKNGKKFVSK
jgi:hypothetical protein